MSAFFLGITETVSLFCPIFAEQNSVPNPKGGEAAAEYFGHCTIVYLSAWKPANLFLYAVPVFENNDQCHSKQADTGVSGYGLDWKGAFWACFHENDQFHAHKKLDL
jgi:hypothetical protein